MNKLSLIIIGVSVLITGIALLVLTGIIPGVLKERDVSGSLVVWGYDDIKLFADVINEYKKENRNVNVSYIEKNPATFETEFVDALAVNRAPDVVIFPSSFFIKHKNKLSAAPPILITEREINQNFVEAASFFLTPEGQILGMPFFADVLVLYWNKDLFTQNFITLPPKTWDEFANFAQTITRKNDSGNITISGAAMGRATNIKNADLILTALFLQAGENIISNTGEIILGNASRSADGKVIQPAESSLRFFSDFADPIKVAQSWSPALPAAQDYFISGRLGMYFGTISEFKTIKEKNPHLNFGVTVIPQLADSGRKVTSGELYAIVVPALARNYTLGWNFAKFITNQEVSSLYANSINNVSLWRSILPSYFNEDVRSVFAESVLALKLWPNPDPEPTRVILNVMIENIALKRSALRESITNAKSRFRELTGKNL